MMESQIAQSDQQLNTHIQQFKAKKEAIIKAIETRKEKAANIIRLIDDTPIIEVGIEGKHTHTHAYTCTCHRSILSLCASLFGVSLVFRISPLVIALHPLSALAPTRRLR